MTKIFVPLAISRIPANAQVASHFVRESYLRKLYHYGLTPVLVPALTPIEVAEKLYAECAGVLFTGGGDIDPKLYGEQLHPKTEIDDPRRDEFELYFLKKTLADKKPYLGICRGCQMLAVASGGSLYQHVPDIAPSEHHGVSEGGTYDDLLASTNGHEIVVTPGTRAFDFIQKEKIAVNSGHHQSVNNPGTNLVVSGKSEAGIVEILEHTDKTYFCFGLQSHPECCNTEFVGSRQNDKLDVFFEMFANASKR